MADIDRQKLGEDVATRAIAGGRSYRAICDDNPGLTIATITRAASAGRLSPGNLLAICRAFGLDPWAYYQPLKASPLRRLTMKTIVKQAVTRKVSRETHSA
jgi:hypothetical protein